MSIETIEVPPGSTVTVTTEGKVEIEEPDVFQETIEFAVRFGSGGWLDDSKS